MIADVKILLTDVKFFVLGQNLTSDNAIFMSIIKIYNLQIPKFVLLTVEEISLEFSTGTAIPVSVYILACNE